MNGEEPCRVLIWSLRQGGWYRPGSDGYTPHPALAGRYTRSAGEAKQSFNPDLVLVDVTAEEERQFDASQPLISRIFTRLHMTRAAL